MADTLESTGQYLPKDLRVTAQPNAVDKDKFDVVATGLKIDETYSFQFQYVFADGTLSDWSPGYTLNTPTESVPGAPSASIPSTSVGNIPVTLSAFPANAKRVDIYVIGGIYGTGKVVDHFLAAGTKTISISDAGVYQVSLITVTASGINGDPTNTFTITVTGQQQVVEAPTLPTGLTVSSAPFAVAVNWGGQYSGSNFEGFKSIDVHVRSSDVGATSTSGFSTTTQVATLTVNSTTNRQNIGLDNIRQALSLASNDLAYTTPLFFYYIARNENDELYKVGGVATYTRINSSTVNPTKANFVDLENGVISIENLVAGNGQFSSWLRTGSVGGARIELSGTDDFTPSGESIAVKKGITAYSTGSTEIFRLDIGTTPKLTIKGDGEFTGDLSIGTGNNIFKAEPATGIWLGNSAFASAPFSVSKTGILTAQSGTIGGWAINSTQIRSNGVNQISLNPVTPKIAIIQGSTLNAVTGLYEGGTEKITIDPVEGIVGPNITYNGSQVPSFKLTPSGNLTLYGSITITGGQAQTDINDALSAATSASSNATSALNAANSKIKSYYQNDAPTGGTYVEGDLWFELDNGNKAYRWSGSAWVAVQDTKVTNALQKGGSYFIENASNQLTQINSSGIAISSTGFQIVTDQGTAVVGASKLVLNSAGITARDASNNNTFTIDALTGSAEFKGAIKSGSTITGADITMTGSVNGYGVSSTKLLFQASNYAISAGSSSYTYNGTSGYYDSEGEWVDSSSPQTVTNTDIRFTDATLAGAVPGSSSGFSYGELWLGGGQGISASVDLWANYPGGFIGISVAASSSSKNIYVYGDSSAGFTTQHRSSTSDSSKESPAFLQVDSAGRMSRGRAVITGSSSSPNSVLGLTGDLYFSTAV
jgi:hypothetical protein